MLFVLLYSQRVASHSCETLRELQHDPYIVMCKHQMSFQRRNSIFGVEYEQKTSRIKAVFLRTYWYSRAGKIARLFLPARVALNRKLVYLVRY